MLILLLLLCSYVILLNTVCTSSFHHVLLLSHSSLSHTTASLFLYIFISKAYLTIYSRFLHILHQLLHVIFSLYSFSFIRQSTCLPLLYVRGSLVPFRIMMNRHSPFKPHFSSVSKTHFLSLQTKYTSSKRALYIVYLVCCLNL